MTKQELIAYCLTFPSAYEDYPFDDQTAVMRHRSNTKMFALIAEREGKVYINLKCDPIKADFLRTVYQSVTPGFHMNKTHWNSVDPGGDVPRDELFQQIQESFDLTAPKGKKQGCPR